MSERTELIQFPYSHFNEKARWALDYKAVPHSRRNLLPGPHIPVVKRLTGQTAVPVLRLGDETIAGSAAILARLEETHPDPRLVPDDPETRRRALEIQARFDAEVGPAVRCAFFSIILDEPDYACTTFSFCHPAWVRGLYRATYPLAKRMIAQGNGVTSQAAIDRAFATTEEALDFVAREAGPQGHLAGDRFSAADLTAAALLAICANPGHPDMHRAEPLPAPVREWYARWDAHPGTAWVRSMYERHRPAGASTD